MKNLFTLNIFSFYLLGIIRFFSAAKTLTYRIQLNNFSMNSLVLYKELFSKETDNMQRNKFIKLEEKFEE